MNSIPAANGGLIVRKKGRGYQALINQVLRTYAELRLAQVLEGPEDRGPSGEAL